MGLCQIEQGFSSYFAKFFPYLMIFQSSAVSLLVCSTLKNHQIWQCLKPISPQYCRYPKPRFWIPILPLGSMQLFIKCSNANSFGLVWSYSAQFLHFKLRIKSGDYIHYNLIRKKIILGSLCSSDMTIVKSTCHSED